jgi:LuxR family transcriptional regulator, maltose regulon positive regulatory protein
MAEPTGGIARLRTRPPVVARDFVVRPRLLDRLDEATTLRCTLVAAGPGYGKSQLLASWVARQERFSHVAWLTVDAFDGDPQRLCALLLAAFQGALRESSGDDNVSSAARAVLDLRTPPVPPYETFVEDALVPALERLDEPVLLIADDVHHLAAHPTALSLLDSLLRWSPDGLHVVLAGRVDPPLGLQRLRLSGQLSTLRQAELACGADESTALLRAVGLEVSDDDATALHELTHGWPAGLRLAALSLLDYGDVPEFLERFATRDVALADYLATEVIQGLPDWLCEFVLRATVDDLVCADLVDEVTGSGDGAAGLAECERRNLFLTHVPGKEVEWYAWHHMFAGQMRRRLALADPDEARRGHLAAARWWQNRDPGLAVQHALSGADPDLAAEILASEWLSLTLRGESSTLLELIDMLAEETSTAAELHLAACYAHLIQGATRDASAELSAALGATGSLTGPARWRFDCLAAWLRLLLVDQHTSLREAVVEAERVLDVVPATTAHGATPEYALALLALGMGLARLQEDAPRAVLALEAAAEVGRAAGFGVLDFVARAELCIPMMAEGDPGTLTATAQALLEEAKSRGWADFSQVSVPLGVLAWLTYWRGHTERARHELERFLETCPRGDWSMRGLGHYFHARASLLVGELDAARQDLADARGLVEAGCLPPHADSLLAGLNAEILAATGDLDAALASLGPSTNAPEYRMTSFTRADLLRRSGHPHESLRVLEIMAPQRVYPHTPVVEGVLRALARHALGEAEKSLDDLEKAVAAARPAGILQPFLDQAAEVHPLLDALLARGTTHEVFVSALVERLADPVPQPETDKFSRLTQRELSILRYMRTSMPNAEIAAELFVSINTVKTHTASVYRKLGVTGRREAVRRAEELGLFGSPSRPATTPVR